MIKLSFSSGWLLSQTRSIVTENKKKLATMPSNNKEKDVLERQKLISRMMAKKRPSQTTGSNNGGDSRKRPAATSTSSSSSSSAAVASSKKRPRLSKQSSSKPSAVIDLTEETPPKSKGTSNEKKKVIMGIHKSYKRPSPAAVMAAARAKAKALKEGKPEDNDDDDDDPKGEVNGDANNKSNDNNLKTTRKRKLNNQNNDNADTAKKVSKKRLANLVQNAATVTAGQTDEWSSSSVTSDITPEDFWKKIRIWDFVAQLAKLQLESNNYNNKNNNKNGDDAKEKKEQHKVVPDTFINARHYVSVWAPLCIAECKAQLLSDIVTECGQTRGNRNTSPFVLVKVETTWKTGRNNTNVDYFSDILDSCQVILKIPENQGRSNQHNRLQFYPHDICCLVPVDKKDIVENLLFQSNRGGGGRQRDGDLEDADSEIFKHACIVGHAETHRGGVHGLILKVSKRKWAQVGSVKSGGGEMFVLKIGSNITALREFTALASVDSIPLKHYLLGTHINDRKRTQSSNTKASLKDGDNNPDLQHSNKKALIKSMGGVDALGKGFTEYAQKKFNASQLHAISASSQGYGDGGFTLIKGPPVRIYSYSYYYHSCCCFTDYSIAR